MVAFKKDKWIYKHAMDLFKQGELVRIKETGEVFTYHSSTGGANFSSYLVLQVGRILVDYPQVRVHEIEKVNKHGVVIDDFEQHRR